jgi:hypothetical protein
MAKQLTGQEMNNVAGADGFAMKRCAMEPHHLSSQSQTFGNAKSRSTGSRMVKI